MVTLWSEPGSPTLGERTRWVVAVKAPAEPPIQLTPTLPALTRAVNIFVLETGSKKAGALQHVLTGTPDPENTATRRATNRARGRRSRMRSDCTFTIGRMHHG